MKSHEMLDDLEPTYARQGKHLIDLAAFIDSLSFREEAIKLVDLAYAAFDKAALFSTSTEMPTSSR